MDELFGLQNIKNGEMLIKMMSSVVVFCPQPYKII